MTIEDAKQVIAEFDRLGLELADGLNLLTENGVISDLCIEFRDISDVDGKLASLWIKNYHCNDHGCQ